MWGVPDAFSPARHCSCVTDGGQNPQHHAPDLVPVGGKLGFQIVAYWAVAEARKQISMGHEPYQTGAHLSRNQSILRLPHKPSNSPSASEPLPASTTLGIGRRVCTTIVPYDQQSPLLL